MKRLADVSEEAIGVLLTVGVTKLEQGGPAAHVWYWLMSHLAGEIQSRRGRELDARIHNCPPPALDAEERETALEELDGMIAMGAIRALDGTAGTPGVAALRRECDNVLAVAQAALAGRQAATLN